MGWFSSDSAPQQASSSEATSPDGTFKPTNRNQRQACWEARDIYFGCLDKNSILDAVKDSDTAVKSCPKENELFEKDCATSWVKYFKQKRVADYNKEQQLRKLEAEGAIPIDKANEGSRWKIF